jgi:choice-of-anchor B domain-containing protein
VSSLNFTSQISLNIYMKFKALLFALVFSSILSAQTPCVNGMAGSYPCSHVDLLSFVPLSAIGGGENTNDIWGWVSPNTGKEYALVGCHNGTAFLDITDPVTPVYLGILPSHSANNLWRDLETYKNYCFIGSEAFGHGLQIFDLTQLDNVQNIPATFQETAHYAGFGNSHTIAIDTLNGYLYANGTNTYAGGLHIVDISNPLQPTLAGGFALEGYTHDCFIWNYDGPDTEHQGKQIVFACNGTKLAVVDCTDKTDCESLGNYAYPNLGYVHQGWVTKDKRHFLLNDELDEQDFAIAGTPYGTRTHIFEISNLDQLTYEGYHEADNSAIDHNFYIDDHFMYQSNYRSGLRILDVIRIEDGLMNEIAYFDLFPTNDAAVFSGTWSNYAFLPSGVNIATSMYEGVFITRPNMVVLSQKAWDLCNSDPIEFELTINSELAFPLTTAINGLPGASINNITITETGAYNIEIGGLENVAEGVYTPRLLLQTDFNQQYEIPLSVVIADNSPVAPTLIAVEDGGTVLNLNNAEFSWTQLNNASTYQIQISSTEDFGGELIVDQLVSNNSIQLFVQNFGSDGYWRVRGINDCGEGEWSEPFFFVVYYASVEGIDDIHVKLFPNPVQSLLQVIANKAVGSWQITDMTGRVVESSHTNQHQLFIDVEHLSSGVYLFTSGTSSSRFIKQ